MKEGVMKDRDLERRRRARNFAVGGVLLALAILFYLITVVRMGGE
jgi:hypothetical protein